MGLMCRLWSVERKVKNQTLGLLVELTIRVANFSLWVEVNLNISVGIVEIIWHEKEKATKQNGV